MEEKVIEFRNVTKRFGERAVLSGLSFEVKKGEVFAIVGPSGTGKSVTLKHIAGLLEPDSGEVVTGAGRIGYLFQSGALLAWMDIYDNVALPLRETTKLGDREIDEKVMTALKAVGLEAEAEKYPSEISGGMQKRAGLARAIVRNAEIILYDEPTSGLDPVTSAKIHALITRLNEERGITSVLVTHDLRGALLISDRIMLVNQGKAVLIARPNEFTESKDPIVREFLAAMKGKTYES